MAYSDSIEALKNSLNGYSEEEKKLEALYKNALINAENEFEAAKKRLDAKYKRDRNEVFADSAREERNTFNTLASRGLGFSGEAAQAKLNSDLILANRLGALTYEMNDDRQQLEQDFADSKNSIALESAGKQGDLFDRKNQLKTEIAALELDKEQGEAQIRAEKQMLEQKLAAEKEKARNEDLVKYFGYIYGDGTGGEFGKTGFVPEISEKELAKQLITNATEGGSYINSERQAYIVNRYLLDLKENYSLNSDYYKNLVFILKSYGYEQLGDDEMRTLVISYDANNVYSKKYEEAYNKYAVEGMHEVDARREARRDALKAKLEHIYQRSKSKEQFKRYCAAAGISQSQMNDFINSGVQFSQETDANVEGGDLLYSGLMG